ncbi:hypothetical protein [Nocardia asteroides]|uniref:hypothetical protein n=1 Tax=Nocardia asteroides TaxID=1824 RepID=UPI001E3A30FE|nr:hypothetical protein [Nocardia asteroides]UGT52755.1 hypothetical protein LTT85_18735 [Nocardia asteroides]
MGYPYGPQGNDPYGYAQPGYGDPYGQQGYGAPVYGAQPYPVPGYGYGYGAPGYAPPRASGGTAITAAVISLLLACLTLLSMGVSAAMELSQDGVDRAATMLGVSVASIPVLLWLLGAILLFRRKTAGRVILIIMSTIALLVAGGIAVAGVVEDAPPAVLIVAVIGACIPLLILVCASAPATGRWIRAARQPAYGQYQY